jgi:hypothetical protein
LESAAGTAARPVVQIAIPARHCTELMARGVANVTGPVILMAPTIGAIEAPISSTKDPVGLRRLLDRGF